MLSRGYATVDLDGKAIVRASELEQGDRISVRFMDGTVMAVVQSKEGEPYGNKEDGEL